MKNKFVSLLKNIVNFYNTWYGIINAVLGVYLLTIIDETILVILIITLSILDFIIWRKNVWHNLSVKGELFASYKENNSLCVLGGIGSGKSTLANYLLSTFTPPELRYYNVFHKGYKAFTNDHLLLDKALLPSAGVLVDEAGAQADAFHYGKDDVETRKRIETLNKFYRQWYGNKAHLIYVDQAQGNMNISLYRNIYYVIQCKGVQEKPSALLPHFICKLFLLLINKDRPEGKKINNPFTNVCIEFMEFSKLGDYADHYTVTIQDRDHKKLVGSIYTFFGSLDTYVFKNYNPAKQDKKPYIWGTSKIKDKKIMTNNFDLSVLKQKLKKTFLKK